jgi:3-phosphoshikimate 1-carboxyvinyltransferase
MKLIVENIKEITGETNVPSSKSHTIRGFIFASLAEGESTLKNTLESEDTKAAFNACRSLGAETIKIDEGEYKIIGFNGRPNVKNTKINTLNSGTTTNLISSVAALANRKIIIDGDDSIRKRPIQPLLVALKNLGAEVRSINKNGCPPIEIKGRLTGGKTNLDCKSSQYLSSLLITCPLLDQNTEIEILNVCETPYIEMTLRWLDELGINYEKKDYENILIYGNQKYSAFQKTIPSDWSSATFLLVAAVMIGKQVVIEGLDMNDTQADKYVLNYLKEMGAKIKIDGQKITVNKSQLRGCELDLNNTPDALPSIAILGCFAEGKTVIKNVTHARIKETDRIKAMTMELSKMGAEIHETDDGMILEQSELKGTKLNGYNDHRIVMALSLAGLIAEGRTEINTAEAIKVTFPNYIEVMNNLGANMRIEV